MKHLHLILYILADLCMLYFILLVIKTGLNSPFNYFFAACAVFLFAAGRFFGSRNFMELPKGARVAILVFVCVGILLFIFLESLILSGSMQRTKKDADYVVVLGCRVRGTTPSLSLIYRLEAARDYLSEHPDAKAVLTGGQGIGEDMTEAQAMYDTLVSWGIDSDRLLLEQASTSTKENLEFAKTFIDPEQDSVVLVTTGYHMYRASRIAKKAGYSRLDGYSAKTVWYLVPADYIREALALVKNFLLGNL